jgi:Protein of unknown function (DUF2510)
MLSQTALGPYRLDEQEDPVRSSAAGAQFKQLAAFMGVPIVNPGAPVVLPSSPSPVPAQWCQDPVGRHEYRYWDGGQWTADAADQGKRSLDSLQVGSTA